MVAVQLRDVPDDVHRELKVRAARAGQSLSEYALAVLTEHTAAPTLAEIADRIAYRTAVEPTTSVAEITSSVGLDAESVPKSRYSTAVFTTLRCATGVVHDAAGNTVRGFRRFRLRSSLPPGVRSRSR